MGKSGRVVGHVGNPAFPVAREPEDDHLGRYWWGGLCDGLGLVGSYRTKNAGPSRYSSWLFHNGWFLGGHVIPTENSYFHRPAPLVRRDKSQLTGQVHDKNLFLRKGIAGESVDNWRRYSFGIIGLWMNGFF
ncbi:unnamed protein product [Allacma fusca]|uniref:Uncharacterized protein n=1 Tax=Allacma fusca TaxID=39272 RepID=A0A8J2JV66_9HEXA|nr:unnamed protein product [Allacma fusca]